jgi:CRP-like cAMP-binding protein
MLSVGPSLAPPRNRLLQGLARPDWERVRRAFEPVELKPRQVLHHWDMPMEQIYFVERALVSVWARMSRHDAVEVWLIGSEGMTGVPVVLGGDFAPLHRRVVQVGGSALKIATPRLRRLMRDVEPLREILLRYVQVVLLQTSQVGACNAHHALQERLARWLLTACNGLESPDLPLTHRVLSRLLGVRRASVTESLGHLEEAGAIVNTRGRIRIVDASQLQALSCDCYRMISAEYRRLLGGTVSRPAATAMG